MAHSPPSDFLSIIHTAGLSERLSEVMLFQSLAALRAWDDAGLNAPLIGVNFSTAELRNPKLVEKVKWELDRFDLTPDRLCIEILETVFSNETDGTVIRNISGLSELGCRIDLDDFGTGNASNRSYPKTESGQGLKLTVFLWHGWMKTRSRNNWSKLF